MSTVSSFPAFVLLIAALLSTSVSAVTCGEWLKGQDFSGSPIDSEKGHSHDSCVSLCSVMDSCSHVRLRVKDGKCELLSIEDRSPRKKDGADSMKMCAADSKPPPSDGSANLPDVESPTTAACGTWIEDHDVRGSPMSSEKGHSRSSCESKCFHTDGCGHVRLRPSDGKCEILDTSPQKPRYKSGYESLQLCFRGYSPAPPGFEKFEHDDGECIVRTVKSEIAMSRSADVHAKAIAEAFSVACAKGDEVNVEDFSMIFRSDGAFAFAQTMAHVQLNCFSTSDDYACVSVTETAEAYARATAKAHADAVSAAVSGCGCMTKSVAESFSSDSVYLKLVAKATSAATATACKDGAGSVKAYAFDNCMSRVFGRVFAEATAKAITKGKCLSSESISDVLTQASGDFKSDSSCGDVAKVVSALKA